MGIMGAIMAVSTVGGPLLGGWITDTIGWRWNFYVAVPFAILALIMLQLTLHLPAESGKKKLDYLGAVLISAGFSSLLIWITLGGSSNFAWASWQTAVGAMVGGGTIPLLLAVFVELRAEEPLIPLSLFKNRTFTLSVIATLAVGIAMFGTAVYLGQYTPDGPRSQPHRVKPADHPDDGRPARLVNHRRPADHPLQQVEGGSRWWARLPC